MTEQAIETSSNGTAARQTTFARARRAALLWLGPLAVAALSGWLWLQGGRFVETDNAYLKADMVSISTEIPGKVTEVLVADNARVEKGQLLFKVDDQPYRIALARAEAGLVKVRGDIESLKADYLNRKADLQKAESDLAFYGKEFDRLAKLRASAAVSDAQVDQAEHLSRQARMEVEASRQALQVIEARLIDPGLPVQKHPDYLLAAAELEKARLDLSHVETRAPSSGIIANLELRPGEYLAAGVPLFSIVDDSHVWVEANFKETDLTWLREGQPAMIEVDSYPGREWTARVLSITPGTGSEFSILPAQNSSGNWVKVVQRIKVKLELEALADNPGLRAGMSALVEVDTGHERRLPWRKGA